MEHQQLMIRFEPGYLDAQAIQTEINELGRATAREENRASGSVRAEC